MTRDELRQALWPGDTFVDFDHGLNNSIKRIRDALGDSADTPRYIETLPRLGYRFIGGIDVAPAAPSPVAPSVSTREILRPARWKWSFFRFVIGPRFGYGRYCGLVVLSTGQGVCVCGGDRPPDRHYRETEVA